MKVSVIVPAFNEERLLPATLAAIRAASGAFNARGWASELIVCDNNSTDRTAEISSAAGATVVFEPVNQIARARNAGAALASGEWLVFIDADSQPTRELFDELAAEIEGGRCLAGGSAVRFETGAARFFVAVWNGLSRICKWAAGSFVFCRADAFRQVGGFSEALYAGEEIDLSRKLKRLARKTRRRVVILHRHPLATSDRKLRLYRPSEVLAFMLRATLTAGRALRDRDACFPWYDGRRQRFVTLAPACFYYSSPHRSYPGIHVRSLIFLAAVVLALAGCHAKSSAPGEAPTGVTVTPGDGLVVISWNMLPDLTYWIFFAPGDSVTIGAPGSFAIRRAFAPRVIGGLANDTKYAFIMNATNNDSPAGPASLPVPATPQLAGGAWSPSPGTPLGTQNLNSMAFNGSRFVTVGDAGTIFAGDFNYTSTDPQGVSAWTAPTTPPPPPFSDNLTSIIYNGTFIALGANGSVISSGDGLNWGSNVAVPGTGMTGLASGFVGGVTQTFIAVGSAGKIFFSTDLVNWFPATSNTTNDLTGISLVNGTFFATGAGGTLLTSSNAVDWSVHTTNTTSTLRAVTFGPSSQSPTTGVLYVAVGDAGTIITTPQIGNPPETTVWTPINPAPIAQSLRSITLGGATSTRFLAVGQGGGVVYSDDGFSWTPASSGSSLAKVIFAGGLYLGIGDAGASAVSR